MGLGLRVGSSAETRLAFRILVMMVVTAKRDPICTSVSIPFSLAPSPSLPAALSLTPVRLSFARSPYAHKHACVNLHMSRARIHISCICTKCTKRVCVSASPSVHTCACTFTFAHVFVLACIQLPACQLSCQLACVQTLVQNV